MSKKLLREYYELCEGGVCQDLLTEEEKRFVADGGMILSGIMQKSDTQNQIIAGWWVLGNLKLGWLQVDSCPRASHPPSADVTVWGQHVGTQCVAVRVASVDAPPRRLFSQSW